MWKVHQKGSPPGCAQMETLGSCFRHGQVFSRGAAKAAAKIAQDRRIARIAIWWSGG